MCSPGVAFAEGAKRPDGTSVLVWSLSADRKLRERRNPREPRRNRETPQESAFHLANLATSLASRLYFGSLYKRPPPILLSFV
jgi:hypothetical protein